MPDVLYEGARADYDDAMEIFVADGDGPETVGVATFSVDRDWGGSPTGIRDPLPIRLYIHDPDGDLADEAGKALMAYLSLEEAREVMAMLEAAILQVELTRDRRRRAA